MQRKGMNYADLVRVLDENGVKESEASAIATFPLPVGERVDRRSRDG